MEINVTITLGGDISIATEVGVESTSNGGVVDIINQDDEIIASVTAPGEYQVMVLTEINDEEPYEDLIIDDN